jgi:hypothetical protein
MTERPLPAPARDRVAAPSVSVLKGIGMATGPVALACSMLSFYTTTVALGFHQVGSSKTVDENAWNGFFGWFAVLLALAASALMAYVALTNSRPAFPAHLLAVVTSAVALVCIVVAAFVTPGSSRHGDEDIAGFTVRATHGRGVGFWITFAAIVVGVGVSVAQYLHARGPRPQPPTQR